MAKRKNSFQVLFSFISQDIHNLPLYYNHALRREHVTSSDHFAYTPMRSGQIPNNPYIIAKNVPHPGAFFVFGGVAAAIVVTAKIYVAEK